MFDLLLRDGLIVDGTGASPTRGDVGILGDRVGQVGDLAGAEAAQTIPCAGRLVCPGFIDVHSHSDAFLLIEPGAQSKIAQGITTEVIGNCGASAAPRSGAARMPADWQAHLPAVSWRTLAEYRHRLAEARPAVNVAALVGHNTLRGSVLGYDPRPARPDELADMIRQLEQALDEGAVGLSTGLAYAPGMFAPREEIHALAAAVARRGGIYTSHMRSEGSRLIEAIEETLEVGRATAVRVQISHLKTSGPANWHKLDAAIGLIERARAEGIQVVADRYPYTASSTDLDILLPPWAAAGTRDEILGRLQDSALRERIRAELESTHPARADWERVVIGSTGRPQLRRFTGRSIAEAAEAEGVAPATMALALMIEDELRTQAFFHGMSEANMWRILALSWVMIGSDASLRSPKGPLGADHPHPRAYGTMPRFLRAALDGRSVPIAEAVRKMTSLPAQQFGLRDRGKICPGAAADIVVIDPRTVRDTADFAEPHRFPEGVETVIVNGVPTLQHGRWTGLRAGRWLPR